MPRPHPAKKAFWIRGGRSFPGGRSWRARDGTGLSHSSFMPLVELRQPTRQKHEASEDQELCVYDLLLHAGLEGMPS